MQNEKYTGDALLQKTYTVDFLSKNRVKNNGIVPQYYVEGSHEAIIPRDLYMQVQEEMVRRANLHSGAKRKNRVYSSRYELSSIVYCPMCGEIYLRLGELQQELLRLANSKNDYTDLTDEIYRLWEERQAILVQDAECDGKRQRIEEMKAFLEEQADLPAEYNEQLVRRLIEKVTVFDEKITVRFKSGVKIDVEK